MITTLNQIRECEPCKEGWEKLLKGLNKTRGDDEPLKILKILGINGYDDALWTLRSVKGYDKELRLYALSNAKSVRHLIPEVELEKYDKVLKVIEDYAYGKATLEELKEAREVAWESAWEVAWEVALESAWESARESAWESAWESALASAWESARALARASARASAWALARASAESRFKEFLEELER